MKEPSLGAVPAELLPLVLGLLLLLGVVDQLGKVVLLLLTQGPGLDSLRGLLQGELWQLLVVDLLQEREHSNLVTVVLNPVIQ